LNDNWIIKPADKILITGAAGFVGSKVLQTLLSYGFTNLRCIVKPTSNIKKIESIIATSTDANIEVMKGNLISRDDCRHIVKDVSVIYHLAAGIAKSYPDCFLNSVVTTRNLLDAVIKEKILKRFVNISSIAVYSNDLLKRSEPYTYGKAKQDALVLDYAKKHNLPYVTIRPSVVFGPGKAQITSRVGSDTFGIFLHLGLNNIIPLTYVDNCAEAIVLAGLRKGIEGQVFNILDDKLQKSKEFLKLYKRNVHRFSSLPVPYTIWYFFNYFWEKYADWSEGQLPRAYNRRKCITYWKGNTYSNQRAKEILGWKPRVNMDESLDRFFAYMREVKGYQ